MITRSSKLYLELSLLIKVLSGQKDLLLRVGDHFIMKDKVTVGSKMPLRIYGAVL